MAFSYSRSLTIDHTKCGASDSTSFPVLVSISDATFKTVANSGHVAGTTTQASGPAVTMPADLIFTSDSAGTTKIPWEIESYDATTGILIAWVKIGTVSHTVDTVFYVFYGDATVTTPQNTGSFTPANVWDTNFKAVWHLGNGTALNTTDSTTNANNGSITGSVPAAAGKIDGGCSWSANTSNHIDIPNSTSTNITTSALTLSCWINYSGSSFRQIMVKADGTGTAQRKYGLYINSSGFMGFETNTTSGNVDPAGSGNPMAVTAGVWAYLTGVYNGSNMIFYVNGVTTYNIAQTGTLLSKTTGATIGMFTGGFSPFSGSIDEVRISDNARGVDWITTEYNNQNSPGNIGSAGFLTFGSEVLNNLIKCRRTFTGNLRGR